MKKLRITVDGKVYDVQVESLDETAQTQATRPPVNLGGGALVSAPLSSASAKAPTAAPGDVVSPLAGRVISFECKVGDKVEAGAQVATIEAMKMNTYVNTPSAGTVSAILAEIGDAVEEGQPLVTIQ